MKRQNAECRTLKEGCGKTNAGSALAMRAAAALAALAAWAAGVLPASAGLVTYEPSDYEGRDALILNFDGIRNAGELKPHSSTATTWVNLADSTRNAVFTQGSDSSRWDEDGFYFGGRTYARVASTSLGADVTVEAVCDVSPTDLVSLYNANNTYGQWPHIIGFEASGDLFNIVYHTTTKTPALYIKRGSTSFPLTTWEGKYAVGIITNGTRQVLVQNDAPHAATWGNTGKTGAIGSNKLLIGSADTGTTANNKRFLTGKIKALRLYGRALSDKEIAANRVLDEARFFGNIPVTNAVVATELAGAEGEVPSGAYAVDADGHVFRAGPSATVGGVAYACTGCTVAKWDDATGDWGAAETRDGVYAVSVSASDKVKITWRWAAADGTLGGDADGYVKDGLALHFDGIRNAGAAAAHSDDAATWTDLSGNGRHGTLSGNANGTSGWAADGYSFNGNAVFNTTAEFSLGKSFTAETLVDMDQADVKAANRNMQVFTMDTVAEPQPCYLYWQNAGNVFRLRSMLGTGVAWGSEPTVGGFTNGKATYLAAFRDGETDPDAARVGVAAGATLLPSKWVTGTKNDDVPAEIWRFGAARDSFASGDHPIKGAIKSVRLYSKLLSEADRAWNRAIDNYRYFGTGAPVSNAVIVASSIAGLEGREASGLWFPDGWSFSAGPQEVRGLSWRCSGYQEQTWDASASAWIASKTVSRSGDAAAVEYAAPAKPFATRRLIWLWEPVAGARTASDYAAQGVAEYARMGLALHFDGILNAGEGEAHSETATTWTDLSGNGRHGTLSGNSDGTSGWTENGYSFNGNAVFNTTAAFTLGKSFTAETLLDLDREELRSANRNMQLFTMNTVADNAMPCYLYWQNGGTAFRLRTISSTGVAWGSEPTVGGFANGKATYLSAFRDGDTNPEAARVAVAAGAATYPASSAWKTGTKNESPAAEIWRFGAARNGFTSGDHPLKGAIKSVRLYDRLLDASECAWNRKIDSARFFGALATTNVVVAPGELTGDLVADAYEVFGTAKFTGAEEANFVKVRTILPDGTFGETTTVDGNEYVYVAGKSPATVLIDFRKTQPFILVVR